MLRKPSLPKRNERCWCGSGSKYKYCCMQAALPQPQRVSHYIDSGEEAVRYVICNARGTGFFSTKDNQILVFTDRATAFAVATLEEFETQEPGEINVAGVGETKWQHLQATLPFVEVADVETAVQLVHERIAHLTNKPAEVAEPLAVAPPESPEQA